MTVKGNLQYYLVLKPCSVVKTLIFLIRLFEPAYSHLSLFYQVQVLVDWEILSERTLDDCRVGLQCHHCIWRYSLFLAYPQQDSSIPPKSSSAKGWDPLF